MPPADESPDLLFWPDTIPGQGHRHGVFDHYLALAIGAKEGELSPEILERHPDFKVHPHYPRHVCAQHRPHAHDLHALLSAVLADSQVELAD